MKIASLPVGTGFAAQTEGAERQERGPDDVAEDRAVLVPTDGGTGRVFGDKDLVKITGAISANCSARARMTKRKSGISSVLDRQTAVEIVAPAV